MSIKTLFSLFSSLRRALVCHIFLIMPSLPLRFVPESIRWLNLNGRQEEAMKLLRRIAKFNKKQLPDNVTLKAPFVGPKVKTSPIDLFVPTKMALQSLVQSYTW